MPDFRRLDHVRNRYVLLADLPLIALAAIAAFAMRLDFLEFAANTHIVSPYVAMAVLVKPVVFFQFGLYSRYWRYASTEDLLAIAIAVGASLAAMVALVVYGVWSGMLPWFPRSIVFIDALVTLALCGGARLSVRILGERSRQRRQAGDVASRRILVVGAGDAGATVAREMQRNPDLGMRPVGFVDDEPAKRGKRIYGLTVLGPVSSLGDLLQEHAIEEAVIAMPEASGGMLRDIAEVCRVHGVPSKTVPGVYELLGGQVSVSRLRPIDIADLLRRQQASIAALDRISYLAGSVVLVTGAGGSIGSELCRQIAAMRPQRLILLGHGENSLYGLEQRLQEYAPTTALVTLVADIRNADRLRQVFEQHRPTVVIHAAAHKHVPLMQQNPEEAVLNNVIGTKVLTDVAAEFGVDRFVLISTDKAVAPTSVMGATKRVAETIVHSAARRLARRWVVVRFGNVLGSRGSVVPLFRAQIERGGPLTLTHPDMKRFFMTIPEAVHLVLMAGGVAADGEVLVLNMGEQVRVVDLAHDMIRLSGHLPGEIPLTFTGLRPGEKIEEMLWEPEAEARPTSHPDILRIVEPPGLTAEELDYRIHLLHQAALSGNRASLDACLRDLVPTYAPLAMPRAGAAAAPR